MLSHLRIGLAVLCCLLLAGPGSAKEPLVDQVKAAINNGIRFLRELEAGKGDFEHTTAISRVRPGGVTALAVIALLQAGDIGMFGQVQHRLSAKIDAGPVGNVVEHDRVRSAIGERAEVQLQPALRRPRIIRAGNQI